MASRPRGGDLSGRAAALLLALVAAASARAQPESVSAGPVPDWVVPRQPDLSVRSEEADLSDGMHYLLSDMQENVLLDPPASYSHSAWRVLGETGIQNGSQIRVEFDPSYERLVFHDVRVHRDGEVLPRFRLDQVRLLQREERLDVQIYDGTVTALYFVEGVHDGDVVEYSYTLRGLNPTFEGRWAAGIGVRWSVPVVEDAYRLLWPRGRPLAWRSFGTELAPTVREDGPVRELAWEQSDVEPLLVESEVPDWHATWPWIQLSEWTQWSQVADWGRGLFEPAEPLPDELVELARSWREEDPGAAELARRALRLVQDEVRYLGLEFGPKAYQPSEPATVYERRFGDCKDKSVLLVELLHELGLDAAPALVDTVSGRRLPELLPSPLAFDHAVVRLRLDGEDRWLDATRIHERGPIDRLTVPDWAWALVLAEDTEELTPVEPRDFSRTRIEELYESGDYEAPVLFRVRTTYEAADADAVRAYLAGNSREEVQASYRDYYASLWAGIEPVRPLEVEDDEGANVLVTTEQYRIKDFWRPVPGTGRHEASLWCLVLDDELQVPATVSRERPIAVRHPVRTEQRTELHLPEPWELDVADLRVRDAAFRFDHEARVRPDGSLLLLHRYESRADHVAPARAGEYRDAVERARTSLGLTLTSNGDGAPAGPFRLEWALALLAIVSFAGSFAVALLLHARWSPPPLPGEAGPRPPGGPLLLLGLLVMASPLAGVLRALAHAEAFLRPEWRRLTSPDLGDPLREALVLNAVVGGALLAGLGLLAGLQWAGLRRRAPGLVLGFLGLLLLLHAVDAPLRAVSAGDAAGAVLELGRWLVELLVAGLLALYLLLSDRVRQVFVR